MKLSNKDIPEVVGWMTIPDAAKAMGVSRQYAHRLAVAGEFVSLHRIGSTFVVTEDEVYSLAKKDPA